MQEQGHVLVLPAWLPREFNQFMDGVSKAQSRDEVLAVLQQFVVVG